MMMGPSFRRLTEEQQRGYLLRADAAAPAELETAGISKIAEMTVIAWRSHRDADACPRKRESRGEKDQPRNNLEAAQSQHRAAGRPWEHSDILSYGPRSNRY